MKKPLLYFQFVDAEKRWIETTGISELAARRQAYMAGRVMGRPYHKLKLAASSDGPFRGEHTHCEAGH